MSILWAGYISALAEEPQGVNRVIHTRIKATPERKKSKPSLRAEVAWVVEIESAWLTDIQNPQTHATGLIQFMPATAKMLDTTVDELKTMNRWEQGEFVQRYFDKFGRTASRVGDVYLMVFAPDFVGKPDSAVIYSPGTKGWEQNPGLRESEGGPITAGSVRKRGTPPSELPDEGGVKPTLPAKKPGAKKPGAKKSKPTPQGQELLLLGLLGWYFMRRRRRR